MHTSGHTDNTLPLPFSIVDLPDLKTDLIAHLLNTKAGLLDRPSHKNVLLFALAEECVPELLRSCERSARSAPHAANAPASLRGVREVLPPKRGRATEKAARIALMHTANDELRTTMLRTPSWPLRLREYGYAPTGENSL